MLGTHREGDRERLGVRGKRVVTLKIGWLISH